MLDTSPDVAQSLLDSDNRIHNQYEKREGIIEGTRWIVSLYRDCVVKTPRNPLKDAAKDLFDSHLAATCLMQDHYNQNGYGPVPVPGMALIPDRNRMVQERIFGKRLSDLTDEEIFELPPHTLQGLINLISCSLEAFKDRGILKDFPDLPGYNFDLPVLQRLWHALRARRSVNILIDDEHSNVHFVDPDLYYSSCRSPVTIATAALMKKISMFPSARRFRRKLEKALELRC